jgi:hypothetical protein
VTESDDETTCVGSIWSELAVASTVEVVVCVAVSTG